MSSETRRVNDRAEAESLLVTPEFVLFRHPGSAPIDWSVVPEATRVLAGRRLIAHRMEFGVDWVTAGEGGAFTVHMPVATRLVLRFDGDAELHVSLGRMPASVDVTIIRPRSSLWAVE